MPDMDVKILPNESEEGEGFEHHHIPDQVKAEKVDPKEMEVKTLVKMKFPNFAKLVATHSFEDILEKNANEDVILPADLLADLANADLVEDDKKRRVILMLAGVVLGILIAFVFLGGS